MTSHMHMEPQFDLLRSLFNVGDFVKIQDIYDAYIIEIKDVDDELLFKIKYVLDNRVENNIKINSLKVIKIYDESVHQLRSGANRVINTIRDSELDSSSNSTNSSIQSVTRTNANNHEEDSTIADNHNTESNNTNQNDDDNDSPDLSEFKNVLKESFKFKTFTKGSNKNKLYYYLKNGKSSYEKGWIRNIIQQKSVNVRTYLNTTEKSILSVITSMFCGYSSIKGVLGICLLSHEKIGHP